MIHELKCWPNYFQEVWNERKRFEVRYNDRNYAEDDYLILREFDPKDGYTGNVYIARVPYILQDSNFTKQGYVIMSLDEIATFVNLDGEKYTRYMKRFFGNEWRDET